jgi:hypothetical protein
MEERFCSRQLMQAVSQRAEFKNRCLNDSCHIESTIAYVGLEDLLMSKTLTLPITGHIISFEVRLGAEQNV